MIVTLQPWHLLAVVMKSDDDLGDELGRQRWACRRALEPGVGFAVLNISGSPVACFGFVDGDAGVCSAWMVTVSGWSCYVKSITSVFRLVAKQGGYRRIQATVEPERPGAAKFLTWLGFKLDGPMPKIRPDGRSMDLYSYT